MQDENILVVGGYGAVGRVAATHLSRHYPGRVFAGGRNEGKAERLARATGGDGRTEWTS